MNGSYIYEYLLCGKLKGRQHMQMALIKLRWKQKIMSELYLKCIAIPNTGGTPRKISIPIDLVSKINDEFKKYPEGVPMTFENGLETILIKALIIGTRDFYKEPFIFMPEGEK